MSDYRPLPVAASSGDTRQSGSIGYVLEEDGRVLEFADKKVLFVLVEIYMQKFMLRVIFLCAGSAPCGENEFHVSSDCGKSDCKLV